MRLSNSSLWMKWTGVFAVAAACSFGLACARDGAAPTTSSLRPQSASHDDISDPSDPYNAVHGNIWIALDAGMFGSFVNGSVSVTQEASTVHMNYDATITANDANEGGGAGSTQVINQCTQSNSMGCDKTDPIPSGYCTPSTEQSGAPGATGHGTVSFYAIWNEQRAGNSVSTTASCPRVTANKTGETTTDDGSGGTKTCYEMWYVWSDGSHPDEYIGTICFNEGGGENQT